MFQRFQDLKDSWMVSVCTNLSASMHRKICKSIREVSFVLGRPEIISHFVNSDGNNFIYPGRLFPVVGFLGRDLFTDEHDFLSTSINS
jgi:hypothetical protein